jgi:hypothetical protein
MTADSSARGLLSAVTFTGKRNGGRMSRVPAGGYPPATGAVYGGQGMPR